jgi:hypothetical protein
MSAHRRSKASIFGPLRPSLMERLTRCLFSDTRALARAVDSAQGVGGFCAVSMIASARPRSRRRAPHWWRDPTPAPVARESSAQRCCACRIHTPAALTLVAITPPLHDELPTARVTHCGRGAFLRRNSLGGEGSGAVDPALHQNDGNVRFGSDSRPSHRDYLVACVEATALG